MSDGKTLVPHFVPTLAKVLALSEHKKRTPLTAAEVESIRDKSVCIMMEAADAEKLAKAHGYVDVNPANCWADWHRLRAQMIGGYLPRIILCIPGDDRLRARAEPILQEQATEYEFRPHDEKLAQAFKSSSVTWPVFSTEDYAAITSQTTVLYALSKNFAAADAPTIGRTFLKLGRRLLDAGGIAVKSDSSGISHSVARWSKFDDNAESGPYNQWSALFHAYVVYPISSGDEFYSICLARLI